MSANAKGKDICLLENNPFGAFFESKQISFIFFSLYFRPNMYDLLEHELCNNLYTLDIVFTVQENDRFFGRRNKIIIYLFMI